MPTGYTAMLDDNPKMTTQQWIMQGLARAFGICVILRDESLNLTEEQITQRIAEDGKRDIGYHQTELNKAIEESVKLAKRTEVEWETAWQKDEQEKEQHNKNSIARAKKMTERHFQVINDLERILASPEVDEITKNIANYGIEQLKLVKSEREPYIQESIPFEAYRVNTIKSNTRDIQYYTEELDKEKERVNGRVLAYSKLRKDLDAVFHTKT